MQEPNVGSRVYEPTLANSGPQALLQRRTCDGGKHVEGRRSRGPDPFLVRNPCFLPVSMMCVQAQLPTGGSADEARRWVGTQVELSNRPIV